MDAQATPPGPGEITPTQAIEQARQLRASGQAADALELLRQVLKAAPTHIEANLLAGEICLDGNDFDRGRDHFKQVLDIEPSNFRANLGYGKILLANRSWRQAAALLEEAEKVAPADSRAEVKRLLAIAYAQMGHRQKAVDKAQEAVQANPDDLDALGALIQIRQAVAQTDPRQLELALSDADKLVQKAGQAVERSPWRRENLGRLGDAYQVKLGCLQAYHNSFYQRDSRNQPIDRLQPGKGSEAGALLNRMADTIREQALLRFVLAEHDAIMLAERSVSGEYDSKNVKYLEHLVASYQQLQELTARLVGPGVYGDTSLQEQAIEICRRILELEPENAVAQRYMKAVGASLTTQPAAPETLSSPEPQRP
jgi:tetratricopeptide (TPR) repeat protein